MNKFELAAILAAISVGAGAAAHATRTENSKVYQSHDNSFSIIERNDGVKLGSDSACGEGACGTDDKGAKAAADKRKKEANSKTKGDPKSAKKKDDKQAGKSNTKKKP